MSATKIMGSTVCEDCGHEVSWQVSKAGNWYLSDMSQRYDNGARYKRGAHFSSCPGPAWREAREQRAREEAAFREAQMFMDYADAYGGPHPDDY